MLFFIGQIAAQSTEIAPSPPVAIQEEKPFSVGASLGYSFIGYRDETDLPLNRYLNTLYVNLEGKIDKENFIYTSAFCFYTGKNDSIEISSNEDFFVYYQKKSDFIRINLDKALDFRLWGSSEFPGYLGPEFRGTLYFTHLPQTIYYGITVLASLNAHVTQKWIIDEKTELIFTAAIPVFGYAVRPPYYGLLYSPLDMENKITSLHNYQAIFCGFRYNYKINNIFYLSTGCGFELSHISFPQSRKDALIRVNAGFAFYF